jgi:hypothetical protein|tara:strand:- start:411 stop:767 length:357 start_codon:yes stop_codon:yes gene_type:complete
MPLTIEEKKAADLFCQSIADRAKVLGLADNLAVVMSKPVKEMPGVIDARWSALDKKIHLHLTERLFSRIFKGHQETVRFHDPRHNIHYVLSGLGTKIFCLRPSGPLYRKVGDEFLEVQ